MRPSYFCVLAAIWLLAGCTPRDIDKLPADSVFRDDRVRTLVVAAEAGDVDKINTLAKDGVDVNARGKYNVTPLLRSIQKKNKEGFEALLKLGADPNVLDNNGDAVMNLAAEEEDSIWLRQALAHKGNPNLVNTGATYFTGRTPLFFAIYRDRPENVKLLIEAGADLDHQSSVGRPLARAHETSFELVLLLVEGGVKYQYPGFDLAQEMEADWKLGLSTRSEKSKVAFFKTVEVLEKKGVKIQRPEKK
jgi:ankyrin repeat protein